VHVRAVHAAALGDRLAEAAGGAGDIVLIAPFVKRGALAHLLEAVDPEAAVSCVTRWRPEEILAGVSDLDVWPLLRDRGGTLSLVSHLHAKYYRFGYVTFVGSANLTAAALDWRAQANLELLVEARSEARLLEFEAAVRAQAVQVDETLYEHMRALVEALRPLEAPVIGASAVDAGDEGEREAGRLFEERREAALWLPESRTPQVLFDYYRGKLDRLSQGEREAAAVDLAAFPLPLGLEEGAFRAYIGWYLAQTSVVRRVDTLLVEPQRFGAVRASLRRMEDYPRDRDSSRDWQTLMRWLLYFLPDQYEAWEANYSEIFARRS
jgi:hypothetical protein